MCVVNVCVVKTFGQSKNDAGKDFLGGGGGDQVHVKLCYKKIRGIFIQKYVVINKMYRILMFSLWFCCVSLQMCCCVCCFVCVSFG